MSDLLDTLRAAIERHPESLRAISRGSGIDVSALSRLMSGERGLSVESAERLAAYLGLCIRMDRKAAKQ